MIALEVRLNGKRICIAGAEDLAVLHTNVTAAGTLGAKTVPARPDDTENDLFYSVSGLTRRSDPKKDVHLNWKSIAPLKIGDVIQVKVLEAKKADPPKSRKKATPRAQHPKTQK